MRRDEHSPLRLCASLSWPQIELAECTDDLTGATEAQLKTLQDWVRRFTTKYTRVGRLAGAAPAPAPAPAAPSAQPPSGRVQRSSSGGSGGAPAWLWWAGSLVAVGAAVCIATWWSLKER